MSKLSLQDSSKKYYRKYLKKYPEIRKWVEEKVKFIRLDNGQTFQWFEIIDSIMKICPPPKKFLDLGCGPGARDSLYLQKAGYQVLACDVLPEIIEDTSKTNLCLKNKIRLIDIAQKLPFKKQIFDLVFCSHVIQHLEEKSVFETTLPEVKRILKPGGYFFLVFKTGSGKKEIYDPTSKIHRFFNLFKPDKIVRQLKKIGFVFTRNDPFRKSILYKDDRDFKTCLIFVQKKTSQK